MDEASYIEQNNIIESTQVIDSAPTSVLDNMKVELAKENPSFKDLDHEARIAVGLLSNKDNKVKTEAREVLSTYLNGRYGIDGETMVHAWELGAGEKNSSKVEEKAIIYDKHMQTLQRVEIAREGGVKLLNNIYKIKQFGRYPAEMLIDQIKMHEESRWTNPNYEIIGSAEADHFPSFAPDSYHNSVDGNSKIRSIYNQLKALKRNVIAFEYSDEADVFSTTARIASYFGEAEMAFNLSHGDKDRIYASETRLGIPITISKSKLTEGFKIGPIEIGLRPKQAVERLRKKVLKDNGKIVFLSCSVGKEHGFAESVAKYGVTTIGPDADAMVDIVDIRQNSQGELYVVADNLYINPRTGEYIKANTY